MVISDQLDCSISHEFKTSMKCINCLPSNIFLAEIIIIVSLT